MHTPMQETDKPFPAHREDIPILHHGTIGNGIGTVSIDPDTRNVRATKGNVLGSHYRRKLDRRKLARLPPDCPGGMDICMRTYYTNLHTLEGGGTDEMYIDRWGYIYYRPRPPGEWGSYSDWYAQPSGNGVGNSRNQYVMTPSGVASLKWDWIETKGVRFGFNVEHESIVVRFNDTPACLNVKPECTGKVEGGCILPGLTAPEMYDYMRDAAFDIDWTPFPQFFPYVHASPQTSYPGLAPPADMLMLMLTRIRRSLP